MIDWRTLKLDPERPYSGGVDCRGVGCRHCPLNRRHWEGPPSLLKYADRLKYLQNNELKCNEPNVDTVPVK